MGLLDSFEKGLERAVNSAFAKSFRSGIQPVEIAAALRTELDAKAAVVSRDRILAPNAFEVRMSPADAERMRRYAASSPSVVTPLNKYLGYEAAAKVAKQALASGSTIRETVLALGYVDRGELTTEELDAALDLDAMTRP